jgi:hypothetical protein
MADVLKQTNETPSLRVPATRAPRFDYLEPVNRKIFEQLFRNAFVNSRESLISFTATGRVDQDVSLSITVERLTSCLLFIHKFFDTVLNKRRLWHEICAVM